MSAFSINEGMGADEWFAYQARAAKYNRGYGVPPRTPSPEPYEPPPPPQQVFNFRTFEIDFTNKNKPILRMLVDYVQKKISLDNLKTFIQNNVQYINEFINSQYEFRPYTKFKVTPLVFAYAFNDIDLMAFLLSPSINADTAMIVTQSNSIDKTFNDMVFEGLIFGRLNVNIWYIVRGLNNGLFNIDLTNQEHGKLFTDEVMLKIVEHPDFTNCSNIRLVNRPAESLTETDPLIFEYRPSVDFSKVLTKCNYNMAYINHKKDRYAINIRYNRPSGDYENNIILELNYGDSGCSTLFNMMHSLYTVRGEITDVAKFKRYCDEHQSEIDFNETVDCTFIANGHHYLLFQTTSDWQINFGNPTTFRVSALFLAYMFRLLNIAELLIETYGTSLANICVFNEPVNLRLLNYALGIDRTLQLTQFADFPLLNFPFTNLKKDNGICTYFIKQLLNKNITTIDVSKNLDVFHKYIYELVNLPDLTGWTNIKIYDRSPDEITPESAIPIHFKSDEIIPLFEKFGYNSELVFIRAYLCDNPLLSNKNRIRSKLQKALQAFSNDYHIFYQNAPSCFNSISGVPLIGIGNGKDKVMVIPEKQWEYIQKYYINDDMMKLPFWYKFPVYPMPVLLIPHGSADNITGEPINDGDIVVNFKGGGHPMFDESYNPRQKWESEFDRYYLLSSFAQWITVNIKNPRTGVWRWNNQPLDEQNRFLQLLNDEPGRTVHIVNNVDLDLNGLIIKLGSYRNPNAENYIYGIEFCIAKLEEPIPPVRPISNNFSNNPIVNNLMRVRTFESNNINENNIPEMNVLGTNLPNNDPRPYENVQHVENAQLWPREARGTGPIRRRYRAPIPGPVVAAPVNGRRINNVARTRRLTAPAPLRRAANFLRRQLNKNYIGDPRAPTTRKKTRQNAFNNNPTPHPTAPVINEEQARMNNYLGPSLLYNYVIPTAPPMNVVPTAPPMNVVPTAPPMNVVPTAPPMNVGPTAPPMNVVPTAPLFRPGPFPLNMLPNINRSAVQIGPVPLAFPVVPNTPVRIIPQQQTVVENPRRRAVAMGGKRTKRKVKNRKRKTRNKRR